MTYQLSKAQALVLQNLVNQQEYAAAYQYVHDALDAANTSGQIDSGVQTWFGDAAQINANSGSYISQYVRDYTENAGALEGKNITDATFQTASNELAQSVLNGILLSNGTIPSASEIIKNDVDSAVQGLGLKPYDWAGTIISSFVFGYDAVGNYIFTSSNANGNTLAQVGNLLHTAQNSFLSSFEAFTGFRSLPAWLPSEIQTFNSPPGNYISPLVLDLNGDGVSLTALNAPGSVYFDMNQSGFKVATGWVGPMDGLLCIDKNGDGIINDRSELFGNQSGTITNGFAALVAYDSNHDGHITAADAQFGSLRVWIDANSDGISEAGELHTLSSLGITDINLNYTPSGNTIAGNDVEQTSTFTINGHTNAIDDVWFALDNVNSFYNGTYTLNPQTLFLPDLRGYGLLPELNIAMSQDTTLFSMVQSLASKISDQLLRANFDLKAAITNILYEWAGVENVDPASRGGGFDARQLEFLEKFNDHQFSYLGNPNISTAANYVGVVGYMQNAWDAVLSNLSNSLLGQLGLGGAHQSYDPMTDSFSDAGVQTSTAIHFGNSGFDFLQGNATDDVFIGGAGNDNLVGGKGNNTYVFAPGFGNVSILEFTTEGNNTIHFSGIDPSHIQLWTDASGALYLQDITNPSNLITVSASATSFGESNIGQYIEQITFDDAAHTVWSLTGGLDIKGNSIGGFQELSGTAYNDMIGGINTGEIIFGKGGNDSLIAGTGTNYLYGGTGNDTYVFSPGFGNSTVSENPNEGNDTIQFLAGLTPNMIDHAPLANNIISFNGGADTITLTDPTQIENYQFAGYAAMTWAQLLAWTPGPQTFLDTTNNDNFIGSGKDAISYAASASGVVVNLIAGTATGDGHDTFSGIANIIGSAHNDTFISNSANNSFTGGGGTDTVSYASAAAGVTVNLATGTATGDGTDTLIGISNVIGSTHNDIFISNNGNNVFTGNGGIDTVSYATATTGVIVNLVTGVATGQGTDMLSGISNVIGSTHNDTFFSNSGNNVFTGGGGADTVSYAFAAAGVTVNLVTGIATGDGTDTLIGISNVIGSTHNDTLISNSGNNVFTGNGGIDTVSYASAAAGVTINLATGTATGDGNDTLSGIVNAIGSTHNDIFISGAANNVFTGNGGIDTVSYASATNAVTVDLSTGIATGHGTDTLHNIANIIGSAYNDTLVSSSGNNNINGGAGTDTVSYIHAASGVTIDLHAGTTTGDGNDTLVSIENAIGSTHNDIFISNSGNNVFTGGGGIDTVSYAAATSAVTVNLSTGKATGDGSDTLNAIANVMGSSHADTITGNSGNNVIDGGGGADKLYGGTGADTFMFKATTALSASVTIGDFSTSQGDKLNIADVLHSHYNPLHDAINNFVQVTTSGSNTIVKVDIDGTGTAHTWQQIATLTGVTGHTVADLIAHGNLVVS